MSKKSTLIILLSTLLAASLACSLFTGSGDQIAVVEDITPTVDKRAAPTDAVIPPDQEDEVETETSPTAQEAPKATDVPSEEGSTSESGGEVSEYDTIFPLPDDVQDFLNLGDDSINFKTNLSIEGAIEFYRQAFNAEHLTERDLNTAITETTFSMVFDGHSSGKAIVIQGVDLGDGTTNINIRFEDL